MSGSGTKSPRTSLGSLALGIGKLRARTFGGVPPPVPVPTAQKRTREFLAKRGFSFALGNLKP